MLPLTMQYLHIVLIKLEPQTSFREPTNDSIDPKPSHAYITLRYAGDGRRKQTRCHETQQIVHTVETSMTSCGKSSSSSNNGASMKDFNVGAAFDGLTRPGVSTLTAADVLEAGVLPPG
jgi:hypothetical protein